MIGLRKILPILSGFLLLLLAAEWLLPGASPPPRLPLMIASASADPATDAATAQWANIILARPLLSQTRRPPALLASVAASDVLPRLSAIIVSGGSRKAIFAEDGEKPVLVGQGGEIDLYRIEEVAPDKVNLLGPHGIVTLKFKFGGAGLPGKANPPQ